MPLAERRAVKVFQDERLPAIREELQAIAGCEVPLDIHWDKLAVTGESERYMDDDYFLYVFFKPLVAAMQQVCIDDLGKEAVRDGLKSIVLTYDSETAPQSTYENAVSFAEGVLTVNFIPGVNAGTEGTDHFRDRVGAIRKCLEANL